MAAASCVSLLVPLSVASCFLLWTLVCNTPVAAAGVNGQSQAAYSSAAIKNGDPCLPEFSPALGVCDLHCRCQAGRWKCCRVRKDYTLLSDDEANFFSSTLRLAHNHGVISKWFRRIIISHELVKITLLHKYPNFLLWHRQALFVLETLIRKHIDCRFTIPYYDVTKHWIDWWRHSPWDPLHLGGNGQGKQCCVEDGPFRSGMWKAEFPPGIKPTCLKRYWNTNNTMCSPNVISLIFKLAKPDTDYEFFENSINHYLHDKIHAMVGGYLRYGTSTNDPLFWVLHSFIDKVFTTWQSLGEDYLKIPYGTMSKPIVDQAAIGTNFTYAEMSDNSRLPHNAAVCYTSSALEDASAGEPYFVPGEKDSLQWSYNKTATAAEVIEHMKEKEIDELRTLFLLAAGSDSPFKTIPGDCLYHSKAEIINHPERVLP